MSLIQLNSCEGGTNTTVISTANSGGKSGTAFGTIGSSPTFSNTHSRGGMAALCDTGVGAASTWVGQGNFAANYTASSGQFFSRFYGYCPAVPALNQYIWHTQDNAAVRMVAMRHVTSTGAFGFYDSSGTQYAGAAGGINIPLNQFFRFDIRVVPLSSGGIIEWWLFTGANLENAVGGTADDHKTVTGLAITGNGALNQLSYGPRGTVAASYQIWTDDMGTSDAAWLGSSLADAEPLPFGGISVPTQIGVGASLRIRQPDPLGLQTPLAPPKSNTFNSGTDGTTMTTGNTGAANGDAFQSFVLSSTFNTQRHHASGGCAAVPSIVGGQGGGFAWTLLGLLTTPLFVRCYVWLDAYPLGNNATIFRVANGANVVISRVKVNTTGFMVGSDGVATGTPGTVKLALGQWTRIEACFTPDPDGTLSGSTEWRLFNNAEAPLDQWDDRVVFSNRGTGAAIDRLAFGWDVSGQSPSDNVTWYYDDVGMSQQGWLGPTQAPPIVVAGLQPQQLMFIGGPPVPGLPGQMVWDTQVYGNDAVNIAYAIPVAAAAASGLIPVLQDTRTPAEGDAVAAAPLPAMLATYLPAEGDAVAAGAVPVMLDTRVAPVASATAVGPAPVLLDTLAAPVANATAVAGGLRGISLQTSGTGSISSNAIVGSLAVPIGSGVQLGDLIVLVASWNVTGPGSTYTLPTGFTVISSTTDSGATQTDSVGTFYKISDGTEAGTTVTVTHSSTGRCAAASAAFTGWPGATFDGSFPTFTSDNGSAGQTSAPSPSLTSLTSTADMAVLLLGTKQDIASATATTFTPPSGYATAVSASGTASAGINGAVAIGYKLKTNAADETSPTWGTNLSVHWLSASLAMKSSVDVPVMLMTFGAPVAGAVAASPVPFMEIQADPAQQPLTFMSGLTRIGVSGPLLQQGMSPVGDVPAFGATLFAVPVASATGAGPVPVLLDTRQPAEGDATAAGLVPALQATWQPPVAAATAAGNTPILLITFSPPEGDAVAAAPVPLMEITSDPAMQPLVMLGGLPRIGISGPLLQQSQLPVGDVAGVNPVLFAVPVAAATSVGLNPVLMATFAPAAAGATAVGNVPAWPWAAPVGSAIASSPAPVWLDTHLPGIASATGAGQLPALQVTYSIVVASGTAASAVPAWPWSAPVASATAASPTPALLITFTPAEGDATAAAPVVIMAFALNITQDPVVLPFWGPLRTIPGSMTILKEQDPGELASSLLLAIPVASATSAGLVPTLLETYAAGVASVTAAGLTPAMLATVLPLVAAATAAGQAPLVRATYIAGVASATAAGLTPVQAATYGITVASAAAAGLAPVGVGTISPGAASATAAANTPVYRAAYLPATSVVSAAAPVVVLKVTFTPAVGLVTSVALVPVLDVGIAGVHTIYAAEARTTMQSIAAVTLTGMAGTTARTAAPAGTDQGQAGRTGSTGNIDP